MRKKQYYPKVKGVYIKVHNNFFDNVLEPERHRLEKKYGKSLSQIEFTGIMANSNFNFQLNIPKNNMKFAPRKRKRYL